jgi:hypothetical protein
MSINKYIYLVTPRSSSILDSLQSFMGCPSAVIMLVRSGGPAEQRRQDLEDSPEICDSESSSEERGGALSGIYNQNVNPSIRNGFDKECQEAKAQYRGVSTFHAGNVPMK